MTKEYVQSLIKGVKTPKAVLNRIRKAGLSFRDNSSEVGCFSIWFDDSNIRVYQNGRKEMVVQQWQKVKLQSSGIPTYRPSRYR